MDLDKVLGELGESTETHEEPNVLVDPAIQAFCMMRRTPRGSVPPPPGSGRLPLALIERYLLENAPPPDDDGDGDF